MRRRDIRHGYEMLVASAGCRWQRFGRATWFPDTFRSQGAGSKISPHGLTLVVIRDNGEGIQWESAVCAAYGCPLERQMCVLFDNACTDRLTDITEMSRIRHSLPRRGSRS